MNEFTIIKNFFESKTILRKDVVCGIGDDAALIRIPKNQILVTATDTLVSGIHFPEHTSAKDIAYKSLAVNLSDFAAMGADPAWFTLSLTLPAANNEWLENFSDELFELAKKYNLTLVGGDTTRGPLSITINLLGTIPPDKALFRHGALAGDKIYVSGTLGDAGLGLQIALGKLKFLDADEKYFLDRLNRPTPRVELGKLLRGIARSAIDISDGLLADLGHILERSHVGATLNADALPLSAPLLNSVLLQEAQRHALTSGDDYELCFTVPPDREPSLLEALKQIDFSCTCIGEITADPKLKILEFPEEDLSKYGYLHF